jgi:hypothetical protein
MANLRSQSQVNTIQGVDGNITIVSSDSAIVIDPDPLTNEIDLSLAGGPAMPLPTRYIDGLKIANNAATPATKIDILSGICRSDDDSEDIESGSTKVVDIAASGAGGLDTGIPANDTWYFAWIIKNLTTSAIEGLLSLSSTSPTLPAGYTKKRLLGSVRRNGAGNFLTFLMLILGKGSRSYFYTEDVASTLLLLSGGSAETYTDVDCSSLASPISRLGLFQLRTTVKSAFFRTNGILNDMLELLAGESQTSDLPIDSNQLIEYKAGGPGAAIDISMLCHTEDI